MLMTVGILGFGVYLSCVVAAVVGLSTIGVGAGRTWMMVGAPVPTMIAAVIVVLVWRRRR
jgi:hypothetical protein